MLMDWPKLEPNPYLDFKAPDIVRVRGTRIPLELVIEEHQKGRIAEEIALDYPTLDLEAVHGVLAYYLGHKNQVDRYVQMCHEVEDRIEKVLEEESERPLLERLEEAELGTKAAA